MAMGSLSLYVSHLLRFGGSGRSYDEASYVVFGAPFDGTSTFRPGSRFGPGAIREASLNIETYSFRSGVDVESLGLSDLGDLAVSSDIHETLRRVELSVGEIRKAGKTPVLLGGEHTITLGAVRGFEKGLAIICLDAHMDLRDEYMGAKVCHATFMRRVLEDLGSKNVAIVGVRAACREELEYADRAGVRVVPCLELRRRPETVFSQLERSIEGFKQVYLSIDMDVLDPSYAPAVGNPEPDGISASSLLDLLEHVCDDRVCGIDLVEVSPSYDSGLTAIHASKIIFEALSYIEASKAGSR